MPMGFSFQPGADQRLGFGSNGQGGRSVPAPASSVKVLSFRMPKQDVRGALAPSALLNASGAAGQPTGGLSPHLLALLLSAFSAGPKALTAPSAGGPFSGGGGSVPSFGAPRFTPGETDEGPFRLEDAPGVPGLGAPEPTFDRTMPGAGDRMGGGETFDTMGDGLMPPTYKRGLFR